MCCLIWMLLHSLSKHLENLMGHLISICCLNAGNKMWSVICTLQSNDVIVIDLKLSGLFSVFQCHRFTTNLKINFNAYLCHSSKKFYIIERVPRRWSVCSKNRWLAICHEDLLPSGGYCAITGENSISLPIF